MRQLQALGDRAHPKTFQKALEARAFVGEHRFLLHTHMFATTLDFAEDRLGRELVDEVMGPDVVVALRTQRVMDALVPTR